MDSKQKTLLGLTVVAFGFLGYQIFELVSRDMAETPVLSEHTPIVTVATAKNAALTRLPTTAVVSTPKTVASNPVPNKYLKMLSQYELMKMQRQLLDEETAIANAQHRIAVVHHETAQLDGGVVEPMLPASADTYRLSYLDEQQQVWSATLEKQHAYRQVVVGTQLPDGYQVTAINRHGVTLEKGGQRELLTFDGIVEQPHHVTPAMPTPHQALLSEQPKVVAAAALKVAPVHPALPKGVMQSQVLALAHSTVSQRSVTEQSANEGPDKDPPVTGQVPFGMTLDSFKIKPVVHELMSASNFVPALAQRAAPLQLPAVVSVNAKSAATETQDPKFPTTPRLSLVKEHFLALPGQEYTIQLIGSYHTDAVARFLSENHLQHQVLAFPIGKRAHPWTIALYGMYGTFDAAKVRLSTLPERLRVDGAWIRKISDVQRSVRRSA